MNYHDTLRKIKYGAVIYILFVSVYLLVNYFLIELPGWGLSVGLCLILTFTLSPFFRLPSRKASKEKD